jgi:DNA uptake protein ComE-like DNA-binding protein
VYSQRIVENRAAEGSFTSPDDPSTVTSSRAARYDKIRDPITMGP